MTRVIWVISCRASGDEVGLAVVEPSVTPAGILSALLLLDAGHRLQETGIAPDDLGVRRRTLDEVFLSLIGNPAQDPETEAAQ
jgi:hypothetical protein